MRDHDFREVTVDAVMARTGMVRSSFYDYFRGRNEPVLRLLPRIEGENFVRVVAGRLRQERRAGRTSVSQPEELARRWC